MLSHNGREQQLGNHGQKLKVSISGSAIKSTKNGAPSISTPGIISSGDKYL
jgi:hypothetical protein